MTADVSTDPDPEPGDFDAELATIDSKDVKIVAGDPDAELTIMDGADGARDE